MDRLRCCVLLAIVALICPLAVAQTGPAALDAFLAARRGEVGLYAVRLSDGRVLAAYEPDTLLVPASVQKLLTSAVALAVLGPEFQFTTVLAQVGEDLAVIGDGDPTFGDPALAAGRAGTIYDELDRWAGVLQTANITAVDRILLDDAIFTPGRHPDWPANQHSRWYCAPVSGLNYNTNCLDVTLRLAGSAVQAELAPRSNRWPVANEVQAGQRDLWGVRFGPADATATLYGQVKTTMLEPLSVAVNEPSLMLGRVLADRLARIGLRVGDTIARQPVVGPDGRLPEGGQVLATHRTPLAVVMAQANRRSINLMAECLLLRSAVRASGQGSFQAASAVGTSVLAEHYGLGPEQFTLADGSGMSRNNRLSARAVVTLLERLAKGRDAAIFLPTLAIGGLEGTLAKRFNDCPGRVIGKTGSLNGVTTLAGYVLDAQGRPAIAFAFLFNRLRAGSAPAKEVQDAYVADWIRLLDAP